MFQISLLRQPGSVGEKAIGSIQWLVPSNPPYKCKNFADISYTRRVIASFVPNFVAMATGVGRGENAIGSIPWSTPEYPPL